MVSSAALDRLGAAAYVGLLTALASLPVLTAFAAVNAGLTTLETTRSSPVPLTSTYLGALRSVLRRGIAVQLLWLMLLSLGVFDVVMAAGAPFVSRPLVLAVGLVILTTALLLVPFLCHRLDPTTPLRSNLAWALALAGVRPLHTLVLFGGTCLFGAAAFLLPVVLPLLTGWWTLLCTSGLRACSSRAALLAERRPGPPDVRAGLLPVPSVPAK